MRNSRKGAAMDFMLINHFCWPNPRIVLVGPTANFPSFIIGPVRIFGAAIRNLAARKRTADMVRA